MRRPGTGVVESVDLDGKAGTIRSDDGSRVFLGKEVIDRYGVDGSCVGRRVIFKGYERRGGLDASSLQIEPVVPPGANEWPRWGRYARVICRVNWVYERPGWCTLGAEGLSYDIPFHCRRKCRKDLHHGDMVIAEVLREHKGVRACKVVRLPKDYLSKMAEHAHLLTPLP